MPAAKRTRRLPAAPDDVWRVVSDPEHLPRWWPRVGRVESVRPEGFTQVLVTEKGRSVRADFRWAAVDEGRLIAWDQILAGTPFERILEESRTEVELTSADGGTEVRLVLRQKVRGWSKLAPFLFSSAGRKQLDSALDGLERALG